MRVPEKMAESTQPAKKGRKPIDQPDNQQTKGLDPVFEGPAEDSDIALLEPLDDPVAAVGLDLQQDGRT